MGDGTGIRPAGLRDLEAVRALLRAAELPLDGLEEQFGPRYVVAEAGGELAGAAGVEVYGGDGLLRSVVVAPSHRGTGLGKALVAERLDWARRERLAALYLLTTTAPGFFATLGFESVARAATPEGIRGSREFASICPSTATVMRLRL
jgi:N-acetylglutamate synthase-like GNAT family acetyltransferase